MSLFDVLEERGTARLISFVATLVGFLLLHLIRIPFVVIARALEHGARRLDHHATRQASRPPTRPVNQFYPPAQSSTTAEERINVFA